MTARGIAVSFADAGTRAGLSCTFAGANRFDLENEDLTLTVWMRVKGQKPGSITQGRGFPTVTAYDSTGSFKGNYGRLDWTDGGAVEYRVQGEVVATTGGAAYTLGPVTEISNNEDYFYAYVWDHLAQTWSRYYGIDGAALGAATTISCTYSGGSLLDTLLIGCGDSNSFGTNAELTECRVWKRALTSGQLGTEKTNPEPNTTNIVDRWKLLSAADLTGTVNSLNLATIGTVTDGTMDPVDIRTATSSGCLWYGILKA